jgi:hypothetical protein
MPKNRSIQTKIKTTTQDDNSWKTIGRPKKREQASEATNDGNFKKTDSKNTPPRDISMKSLQQDPRTVPIPSSPNSSTDDNIKADGNFLPAIRGSIIKHDRLTASKSSTEFSSGERSTAEQELTSDSGEQFGTSSEIATDSDIIMSEDNDEKFHANKNTNIMIEEVITCSENTNEIPPAATPFTAAFPKDFPPNYSSSRANHYVKPNSKELDAIDSSLLHENERRVSLCLDPFSREFYKATGHSKLQLPDDYL